MNSNFKLSPKMIWTMNIFTYILYLHTFLILIVLPKYKASTFIFLLKTPIAIIPFLFLRKFWLSRITFEINENSVEYRRDFIFLSQKSIMLKDIKEVKLRQGFVQKWYGIGSVEVISHATTQDAGITLYDIKEYKEVYDFLTQKVSYNR